MTEDRRRKLEELKWTLVQVLHMKLIDYYGRSIEYSVSAHSERFRFHFRPDGTGFVEDRPDSVEFQWSDEPITREQLAAIPEKHLLDIADRLFKSAIGRSFKDPYIFDMSELPSVPIEFLSGSRDELERVTRWVCHLESGIFDEANGIEVSYVAAFEGDSGGLAQTYLPFSANAYTMLTLAFEYNPFTGEGWEYTDGGLRRFSSFERVPARIDVRVSHPSAHERAEAYLALSDWLIGKVPDHEHQALLSHCKTNWDRPL